MLCVYLTRPIINIWIRQFVNRQENSPPALVTVGQTLTGRFLFIEASRATSKATSCLVRPWYFWKHCFMKCRLSVGGACCRAGAVSSLITWLCFAASWSLLQLLLTRTLVSIIFKVLFVSLYCAAGFMAQALQESLYAALTRLHFYCRRSLIAVITCEICVNWNITTIGSVCAWPWCLLTQKPSNIQQPNDIYFRVELELDVSSN